MKKYEKKFLRKLLGNYNKNWKTSQEKGEKIWK